MTQDRSTGRQPSPMPQEHTGQVPPMPQPSPGQPPPAGWAPEQPPAGQLTESGDPTPSKATTVRRSRFGGIWVGLIVAAVILILLLVFILQNSRSVQVDFLWLSGHAPVAVAILLGGAAGALLVAVPGTARILQLRKNIRNR